jgi:hypothetical protein
MLDQKVVLAVVVNQLNKNKVGQTVEESSLIVNLLEKIKPIGNDQLTSRKSQDISSLIEAEKVASKKSIYLKAAEFLLKYNVATV